MWAKDGSSSEHGRASSGSEVEVIDDHLVPCAGAAAAAREVPVISNMNIQNSKNVQVGPKVKNVYTTVHNNEVIKGRWLGLEVVTPRATRRLRCCVVVFICWAVVLACGLALYLIYFALPKQVKLDLDLNDTWYLRRPDWQALPPSSTYKMALLKTPIHLAMIGHSGVRDCKVKHECISAVRDIQKDHLERYGDIGPNFLVGGDEGLVFEGGGANVVGATIAGWNSRLVSVMFLGDYLTCVPNQMQLDHVAKLLQALVQINVLRSDYVLYGYCQIKTATISPGPNIMRRLPEFKHWRPDNATTCLTRPLR